MIFSFHFLYDLYAFLITLKCHRMLPLNRIYQANVINR
jgi:hypothetical protein